VKKVEANRNFANKVWNASRFVLTAIQGFRDEGIGDGKEVGWTLADRWIRARLESLVRDVERLFRSFQYGEAGRQIYDFFWSELADWYVEVAKLQIAEGERAAQTVQNLVHVLDTCLRLLHPFTPFITEELWGHLKAAVKAKGLRRSDSSQEPDLGWEEALIVARWPEPTPEEDWQAGAIAEFSLVMDIVRAIRNLRAEKNVTAGRRIPATLVSTSAARMLQSQAAAIASLAYLDAGELQIVETLDGKPEGSIALVVGPVEVYLPLAGMLDTNEERLRLTKELTGIEAQIERLEKQLAGPFAEKAPAAVVQKEREKLAGYRETAEKLRGQIRSYHPGK
jgi:valyl-tRNA synthetase